MLLQLGMQTRYLACKRRHLFLAIGDDALQGGFLNLSTSNLRVQLLRCLIIDLGQLPLQLSNTNLLQRTLLDLTIALMAQLVASSLQLLNRLGVLLQLLSLRGQHLLLFGQLHFERVDCCPFGLVVLIMLLQLEMLA
jgi:hypothetical protein